MNVDEFEQLTGEIIGAAIEVHRVLGPRSPGVGVRGVSCVGIDS